MFLFSDWLFLFLSFPLVVSKVSSKGQQKLALSRISWTAFNNGNKAKASSLDKSGFLDAVLILPEEARNLKMCFCYS